MSLPDLLHLLRSEAVPGPRRALLQDAELPVAARVLLLHPAQEQVAPARRPGGGRRVGRGRTRGRGSYGRSATGEKNRQAMQQPGLPEATDRRRAELVPVFRGVPASCLGPEQPTQG